jgi:hypothetical protein
LATSTGLRARYARAEVDADSKTGAWQTEREIPADADACVQQLARKPPKQQGPQRAVTPTLEWRIKQIVERRDSLVAFEVGRHAAPAL